MTQATSPYLNKPRRAHVDVLRDTLITTLSVARRATDQICGEMERIGRPKEAEQYRHLSQIFGDHEDFLWCDWVQPALDALEGVYLREDKE